MEKRILISLLCFFSLQAFPQWKSFYPEKDQKEENSIEKLKKNLSVNDQEMSEKEKLEFNTNFFEGIKSKSLEDYDKALDFFKKCIKIDKTTEAPHYESSLINKELGNYNLAIEQIKKALNLDSENRWYILLYAEILFSVQDFQNAAIQYKKMLTIEPGNEEIYFMLSEMYIYNKDFKKAINVYNDLQKHKGINKNISLQKYKLYLELNKRNEAIKELTSFLNTSPKDVEVMEILSELYLLNDEKEKAFDIFKIISTLSPENGRIHLTLADYYREQGDNNKSYEELKLAFKSLKLDLDTKIRILVSYYQLISSSEEMASQANELAQILISIYPNEIATHAVYGDILYTENRFQEAKEQYFIVLEKEKSKSEIWKQILFIQAEQGDFSSMLKTSEEALEYFPSDPLFYYFNGISNKSFKHYDEAILSLNTGIEFIVDNTMLLLEFYSSLADSYHAKKEHNLSDSLYEKALEIDPKNVIVLNNYSYYLSLRKVNLDKAKKMSLTCNKLESENGTYQDTYAWILYQRKEFKEAKKWIIKSYKNGGNKNPVIVEHYGDILYQLGEINEAITQWETAKTLGAESILLDKKIKNKRLYE